MVTKSLHAIGFFDFIQDVSSFAACDEDAAYFSRCGNGRIAEWPLQPPNNLSPATSIHPLVAEMPLEDLKLNNDLKLWTMSYFCCEILALQHAVLILAANRKPQPKWIITRQHQHPRIFRTQGLRCLQNSSFLSHQHCEETLFIVLTFGCLTVSQWSLVDTCIGTLYSVQCRASWINVMNIHLGYFSVFPYSQMKQEALGQNCLVNDSFASLRNFVIPTVGLIWLGSHETTVSLHALANRCRIGQEDGRKHVNTTCLNQLP